jgi:hypothetical protein
VGLWVDHDTNRSLAPEGTPSYGTAITVDMPLQYATERLTLALHPLVSLQRFSNHTFANANDAIVTGSANWLNERSSWSVTGLFSELNLMTTELPNTGVVVPGYRQRDSQVGLGWSYAQTERLNLALQANYERAVYSSDSNQPSTLTLQDYRYDTYSGSEQFQHTEQLAEFVTLSGGEFLQAATPSEHTYGAVVGVKWQRSERNLFLADIGVSHTKVEGFSTNGLLYDLTFRRATDTGSFGVTASRSVSPVGLAELTEQDALRVNLQRDLKERLSLTGGLSATYYRGVFEGVIANVPSVSRTYAQGSLALVYRASETWSLNVRGAYSWVTGKSVSAAEGWAVRLEALWTPRPLSASR